MFFVGEIPLHLVLIDYTYVVYKAQGTGIQQQSEMTDVEIPKQCKAGVVVNEGPDFRVEVQMVDVPEPGNNKSIFQSFGVPH